jgi:hypothetical protein
MKRAKPTPILVVPSMRDFSDDQLIVLLRVIAKVMEERRAAQ